MKIWPCSALIGWLRRQFRSKLFRISSPRRSSLWRLSIVKTAKLLIEGQKNYTILNNRRSTKSIVALLNKIRGDIKQNSIREEEGDKPLILIGDKHDAINATEKYHPIILARSNETVREIMRTSNQTENLWDTYRKTDSNSYRARLIYDLLYASECNQAVNPQDALRITKKIFRGKKDGSVISDHEQKVCAIKLLDYLVKKHDEHMGRTLQEFNNEIYVYLEENFGLKRGAKITSGNIGKLASEYTCQDLVNEIQVPDNSSEVRTIHKAKGAEFPVVLLVLKSEQEIDAILRPTLDSNSDEESRIYYVALSRAKDKIVISVPCLAAEKELILRQMGFEIKNLVNHRFSD